MQGLLNMPYTVGCCCVCPTNEAKGKYFHALLDYHGVYTFTAFHTENLDNARLKSLPEFRNPASKN